MVTKKIFGLVGWGITTCSEVVLDTKFDSKIICSCGLGFFNTKVINIGRNDPGRQ